MNLKLIIGCVVLAIIIGTIFVYIETRDTNLDLEEKSPETVESVENIQLQQLEGKQVVIQLSDKMAITGP